MHLSKPWTSALGATAKKLARALLCGALLAASHCALAQAPVMPPAEGASCTVSAVNRNAPVAPDGSFAIFNIPGESGPFRARATCSDGSVGQTAVAFPEFASELVFTGDIVWGKIDPSPVALGLSASNKRLSTDATSQLTATAIAANAGTRDVTPYLQGTTYTVSNALLASVSQNGLVKVLPLFAPGSSARLVATATNEGAVSASYMFVLGPRGSLAGRVLQADGSSPVAGAQVTVVRDQPMEQVGFAVTDAAGNFTLADVSAGSFTLSVIDPASGDRGRATARIDTEGETMNVDIRLNGQGQVNVTVTDGGGANVPNAMVTLTVLNGVRDTRTLTTDASGQARFLGVAAGDFSISTRDPVSRLVGAAAGVLRAGTVVPVALRLQPVATIQGSVYGADGSTLQEAVQVRILSRARGIVSQFVTGADGKFSFDSLPLSDGPYTLDAFLDGRLRTRLPGIVLGSASQVLAQDLRFSAVGTVVGVVSDANKLAFDSVTLTLQPLEGLGLALTATTGPDGRFMIQGVPAGAYTITAVANDGRSATTGGKIGADGVTVTSDIVFSPSGLGGTVFRRDGVTPVGAGVQVFLQSHPYTPDLRLTLNAGSQDVVASTTTNAQGKYSFPVATAATYVIQAQENDDRARTQISISTITPGVPLVANLSFLGKGMVSGVVRDSAGTVQAGSTVRVKSAGAFVNTWETTTDAQGRYTVANVYVGPVTVLAQNLVLKQSGLSYGRLIAEGNSLTLDVTLAATATVQGKVVKLAGTAAEAPLKLDLYLEMALIETQVVSAGNAYAFALVPLGRVSVRATEMKTGDIGQASLKLTVANETRALDIKLVGQGAVRVKVVDDAGKPVAGAEVDVRSLTAFSSSRTALTDSQGLAQVSGIFNGDVGINAVKRTGSGQSSAYVQGTLVKGVTLDVSLTLTARPVGQITGFVFGPDGVTPQPGMLVELSPATAAPLPRSTTDASGRYQIDGVEGGAALALSVRKSGAGDTGRVRAYAANVQIVQHGEVVSRDLQMIGSGSVSGVIKTADGAAAPGVRVRVTNPDPLYGTTQNGANYTATTDASGMYALSDLPAGSFTVLASKDSPVKPLSAEGEGHIGFDGDARVVDLVLVDDAIAMPQRLHDASGAPFDISGDGSVVNGLNNVFTGAGPESRGMRLDILVKGVAIPFKNGDGSIGRFAMNKQQIEVDELHTSGLNVTRRIYVPKTAYFARYLETLENRTQAPITVDVRVSSHHSEGDSNPRVVDSSDGDNVLSVSEAVNRDTWVVVDDQLDADPFVKKSMPATGHVFDGAGAGMHAASASYALAGQTGKLTWQWNSITVEPGQSVSLMHFAFNQVDRSRARDTALRLAQLAPEALAKLSEEERATVRNFRLPADGVGTLAALPLHDAASISGTVLSGDGVSPVAQARVRFKSRHPQFGRTFYAVTDAAGKFAFNSAMNGTADALPIPLYAFELDASHPVSGAASGLAQLDFAANTSSVSKDLVFNGTGNVRGTVRRADGAPVAGAAMRLERSDAPWGAILATSGPDGVFVFSGLMPMDYLLKAVKAHPQAGECCGIEGAVTVTALAQVTTVSDVTLEAVGSVTGIVFDSKNVPVVGARMVLRDSMNREARFAQTDTAGRYRFSDVKTGNTTISATDDLSKASARTSVVVAAGSEAVADITLKGFGIVNVQVLHARGTPASQARVRLADEVDRRVADGFTDSLGKISLDAPVGVLTVTAFHPDFDNKLLQGVASATVANAGDISSATVTLQAAGSVKGSIVRANGSTLAGGFPYTVNLVGAPSMDARKGRTDEVGDYRTDGLAPGRYLVAAYDPTLNLYADAEVVVKADGDEQVANLVLQVNRIALPAAMFDGNRFRFDVQNDGSLQEGTRASSSTAFAGGAILEVNGQRFGGDATAALEAGKRQFAITAPAAMAGLTVTRKVYVPAGGYFARYLEVFENPGATAVTLDVKVATNYPSAALIGSSSKANSVSRADNWVVLDDQFDGDLLLMAQQPSTAHVFGQTGALRTADLVALGANGKGSEQQLAQQWQKFTVPAGKKVALMHFVVQQINRAGATEAARRLAQLAPEAIDDLTSDERLSVVNFTVPADGASSVAAMPSLGGQVNGRVFEGDGVTAVDGVFVTVQSLHPLYSRVWGAQRDRSDCATVAGTRIGSLISATIPNPNGPQAIAGVYSLVGRLETEFSVPLPQGSPVRIVAQEAKPCFSDVAGHAFTHIASRSYTTAGVPAVQDVLFDSGVLTGTVHGAPDLGVTGGKVFLATDANTNRALQATVGADGSYVYPGLAPGSYDLVTIVPHSQGTMLRGERSGSVVALGKTTVTDIDVQETGSISGFTQLATGEASVGTKLVLSGYASEQAYDGCSTCSGAHASNTGKRDVSRTTLSDSLGNYNFNATPLGRYLLSMTDASGNERIVPVSVNSAGEHVIKNMAPSAKASVQVTVLNSDDSDLPMPGVDVTISTPGYPDQRDYTNAAGQVLLVDVPEGDSVVTAHGEGDPARLLGTMPLKVTPADAGKTLNVTLKSVPNSFLSGTVSRSDGTPVVNSPVSVFRNGTYSYGMFTDLQGAYRLGGVSPGGTFEVRVEDAVSKVVVSLTVDVDEGGKATGQDLVLPRLAMLTGQATNPAGAPLQQVSVVVSYAINEAGGRKTLATAWTDANGRYSVPDVPMDLPVKIVATPPNSTTGQTTTTSFSASGPTVAVPTFVFGMPGKVRMRVTDTDGLEVPLVCTLGVYNGGGSGTWAGESVPGGWSAEMDIVAGTYLARAFCNNFHINGRGGRTGGPIEFVAKAGEVNSVTVVLSKIGGTVRYSDGTPVAKPYVSDNHGYVVKGTTPAGLYYVYDMLANEPITFAATDAFGLTGKFTGTTPAKDASLLANITMEANGTVAGVFVDGAGAPIAGATVYARNNFLWFARTTTTAADGTYRFERLALGGTSISATDSATQLEGRCSVELTKDGQELPCQLVLQGMGTVSGTVFDKDGVTPVGDATVEVRGVIANGAREFYRATASVAADGTYTFTNVPAGQIVVSVIKGSDDEKVVSATTTLTLADGAASVIPLSLGSAMSMPFALAGSDGFDYTVTSGGALSPGTNEAYSSVYILETRYKSQFEKIFSGAEARLQTGGRELEFMPVDMGGFAASRRVFVPAAGGYARYIDSYWNVGTSPRMVPVRIFGWAASYSDTRVVVSPASVDQLYAITEDALQSETKRPVLGHVFGAPGAGLVVKQAIFNDGDGEMDFRWDVVIPPGKKVSVMYFGMQKPAGDVAAAKSTAQALIKMSDPDMFKGMSAEDKAAVLNFPIPK
ncbi:carboxypeptidase-like regulatory domain-containing protein [Massilia scottii]|uniref:carboxypeptidase-like regulatory domain-containing protein n=1 Tax=Massilia scottii TaxID=3057166 RepID=UPI002796A554|nr:carboxypeptidase-like regulatory domain-containing protein [Massilia sp. CCM 9029]MDQ1832630.1 carboxypeptidase-like regulatory domain-containing protein [Massilia sp. CCM 9029]